MLTEEQITNLVELAHGNFDLVSKSVVACLKQQRKHWWSFKKDWIIDIQDVIEYIKDHDKKLEELTPDDI